MDFLARINAVLHRQEPDQVPFALQQPDAAQRVRAAPAQPRHGPLSAPLHRVRRRPTCRWRRATKASPSSPPITRKAMVDPLAGPCRAHQRQHEHRGRGLDQGQGRLRPGHLYAGGRRLPFRPRRLLRRRARWAATASCATGAWTWRLRPTAPAAISARSMGWTAGSARRWTTPTTSAPWLRRSGGAMNAGWVIAESPAEFIAFGWLEGLWVGAFPTA